MGGIEQKVMPLRFPGFLASSPNGRSLAISETDNPNGTYHIALLSLETRTKRQVTFPPLGSWGDRRIAFFARRTEDRVHPGAPPCWRRLRPAPRRRCADTLDAQRATTTGLAWTPDGSEIVFSAEIGNTRGIWRIPASGGSSSLLLTSGLNLSDVTVARDGRLAFVQHSSDENIWRVPIVRPQRADARRATSFLPSSRGEYTPRLSPEGARLLFVSNRTPRMQIWMSVIGKSTSVPLTSVPEENTDPSWAPDGRSFVFHSASPSTRRRRVFRMNLEDSRAQQILGPGRPS